MWTGEPATRRSRRPFDGSRASCIRTSTSTTPRPRRSSRRRPRPTRCSPTPTAAAPTTRSATRAFAPAAGRRTSDAFGSFEDVLSAFFGRGDPLFSELFGFGRAGPASGGDVAARVELTLEEVLTGANREVVVRGGLDLRALPGERRRARNADPDLRDVRRQRRAPRGGADRLRSARSNRRLPDLRRPGAGPREAVRGVRRRGPDRPARGPGRSRFRRGSSPASGSGSPAPAMPARPRDAPGDLYVEVVVAEDERFERHGQDLVTVVEVPATRAMLGGTVTVPTLDGEREVDIPAGAQPGEHVVAAGPGPAVASWRASRRRARGARRVRARRAEQGRAGAGRAARRVAGLDEPRGGDGGWRSRWRRRARRGRLIRLAVRCRPELAERVLAELVALAPEGVEEDRGDGYVEYAIYGAPGELPALPDLEAVAGDGLVEVTSTEVPDDWADRWQDFHRPLLVGGRLWVRPSWEEPREGDDRHRGRPRPGVRHRRPSHHQDVPRAPAGAGRRGAGARRRWPTGAPARGCWRSPRRSSGSARSWPATTSRRRSRRPARTPRRTGSSSSSRRVNLRQAAAAPGADRGRQPDRAAAARGRRRGSSERPSG